MASNSVHCRAMGRTPLDGIYGTFVTFETATPSPNKNKLSAKFLTGMSKHERKVIEVFKNFFGIQQKHCLTGIFFSVNGSASGTLGLKTLSS